VDKRVAPDGEGAANKQCQGEGKPLITISDHKPRRRQEETTSAISQDSVCIRISRTCSTAEDWRERETENRQVMTGKISYSTAMCNVLPALGMTSCFQTVGSMGQNQARRYV